jgi:hypothetical protein
MGTGIDLVPQDVVQRGFDRMDGEIRGYRLNLVVSLAGNDVSRVIQRELQKRI